MSRSWACRAQAEPLAVLAATAAVAVALATYAGVVADVTPAGGERSEAGPVADRAAEALRADGVVDPASLRGARSVAPDGFRVNVSLTARDRRWTTGREPPADAAAASRVVPVRVDTAVAPGRVRVEVWS